MKIERIPLNGIEVSYNGLNDLISYIKSPGVNGVELVRVRYVANESRNPLEGTYKIKVAISTDGTAEEVGNRFEGLMKRITPTVVNEPKLTPIGHCGLSNRTRNALECSGIKTLEEVAKLGDFELKRKRGIGTLTLKEIRSKVAEYKIR